MIAFDDCKTSTYSEAFAYMQTKGVKGTTYCIQNLIGTAGYMTEAQLLEVNAAGWDVGNHTATHQQLTSLPQADQQTELSGCANYLDGLGLTRASKHVAYPGGYNDATTHAAMLATGMLTGRTTVSGSFHPPVANNYALKAAGVVATTTLDQAKAFVTNAQAIDQAVILIFHDITATPGTYDWSITNFQAFIDWIAAQGYRTLTISQLYAEM